MSRLVLDASVTLCWLFEDQATAYTDLVLDRLGGGDGAVVPAIWPFEIANAVASMKRYAEVEPGSPNPEDSLGEVLRTSGDDRSSLEHYSAALQIDPTYFASQIGLGDTLTLMGDFSSAKKEYDRAFQIAENPRDELNAKYQKALVYFWEGNAAEGRKELAALSEQAIDKKEPNMQFAIALGRAMLAGNAQDELEQLGALAAFLEHPLAGMSESDRGIARATVLRAPLPRVSRP